MFCSLELPLTGLQELIVHFSGILQASCYATEIVEVYTLPLPLQLVVKRSPVHHFISVCFLACYTGKNVRMSNWLIFSLGNQETRNVEWLLRGPRLWHSLGVGCVSSVQHQWFFQETVPRLFDELMAVEGIPPHFRLSKYYTRFESLGK